MTIDLNRYVNNKNSTLNWYEKNKEMPIRQSIAICAAYSGCPNIVLAFYLAEKLGFTDELKNIIGDFIESYKYTKILGQPENSPYIEGFGL